MLRLEARLDRRQFLKYGAVALGGSLVLAQSGDNTIQIYYDNKELVEGVARNKTSPFVRNVLYDHTGSLKKRLDYSRWRRTLDDPPLLGYNVRFSDSLESSLTEQDIPAILELPPLYKDIMSFFYSRVLGRRNGVLDEADAEVTSYPSDFGKGIKHDVYVFRSALNRLSIATPQGDKEIPVEDILITLLEHEYAHAEDMFKGIDLGNGMVINGSNFFDVHPMVTKFVLEERACRRGMELAKQQFGENSGFYWHQLLLLILNQDRTRANLEGLTLTDYDRELVRLQMIKSDEVNPEIKRFEELFGR